MSPSKQNRWVDRGWYLVTEFGRSPALDFDDALELARGLPGYVELLDENLHAIHRNTLRVEDIGDRLWDLLRIICTWQSARAYVNGDEAKASELLARLRCYRYDRKGLECDVDSGRLPSYFGCPRSHIGIWPSTREPWYEQATFDGRVFTVPVQRLLQQLRVALGPWRICPLLDLDAAEALIGRLPELIDPSEDRRWRVTRGAWFSPHAPILEPASNADYYDFIAEHLSPDARGEDSA